MAAISYEVRPSKAVTRVIFMDVLRRLSPVAPIADYQYIGFGAIEFVDFDLIHRQLGITNMISIEANDSIVNRCEWNRPFKGIDVMPGRASTILPQIGWARLSIVWLDYTSTLTEEVIGDIEYLSRVLIPGSVLAVTVNAQPSKPIDERREQLEKFVGADRVPLGVTNATLGDWGLADVQHEIASAAVDGACRSRTDGALWRQLLNIHYSDSTKMQVIAGVFDAPAMGRMLDSCRFDDVQEIRTGRDALHIRVPLLTQREKDWLNARLPVAGPNAKLPKLSGVEHKDLEAYAQVYRRLEGAV